MNVIAKTQQFAQALVVVGFSSITAAATHATAHNPRTDNLLAAAAAETTRSTLTLAARMLAGLPTSASDIADSAITDMAAVDSTSSNESAEGEGVAEAEPDTLDVLRDECYKRLNETATQFTAGEWDCG